MQPLNTSDSEGDVCIHWLPGKGGVKTPKVIGNSCTWGPRNKVSRADSLFFFFLPTGGLEWFTHTEVVLASRQLPKLLNEFTAFDTHSSLHTQYVRRPHCHCSLFIPHRTHQASNWVIVYHSVTRLAPGAPFALQPHQPCLPVANGCQRRVFSFSRIGQQFVVNYEWLPRNIPHPG